MGSGWIASRVSILALLLLALPAGCGVAVTPADGGTGDGVIASSAAAPRQDPSPNPAGATKASSVTAAAGVPYAVTGSVSDAAGRPVVGVLVSATSVDGAPSIPELAVLTDAQGGYRWPSLQPGRYELHVSAPAGRASGRVTVPTSGTATLNLTLAP